MTPATLSTHQKSSLTRQRIAELRVQCQSEPGSVSLHQDAVREFTAAGLTAEALPLLRRLVKLTPDDLTVARQLAAALAERGEHRDAIAEYRRVAEAEPEAPRSFHDLGVAACAGGEYAVAREAFERKVELDPQSYEAYNDLAVLYGMDRRSDDVERAYRRCLTINPNYEKGRVNALQFFWDAGSDDTSRTSARSGHLGTALQRSR
jgi:Flp pilus assembly protein TadD